MRDWNPAWERLKSTEKFIADLQCKIQTSDGELVSGVTHTYIDDAFEKTGDGKLKLRETAEYLLKDAGVAALGAAGIPHAGTLVTALTMVKAKDNSMTGAEIWQKIEKRVDVEIGNAIRKLQMQQFKDQWDYVSGKVNSLKDWSNCHNTYSNTLDDIANECDELDTMMQKEWQDGDNRGGVEDTQILKRSYLAYVPEIAVLSIATRLQILENNWKETYTCEQNRQACEAILNGPYDGLKKEISDYLTYAEDSVEELKDWTFHSELGSPSDYYPEQYVHGVFVWKTNKNCGGRQTKAGCVQETAKVTCGYRGDAEDNYLAESCSRKQPKKSSDRWPYGSNPRADTHSFLTDTVGRNCGYLEHHVYACEKAFKQAKEEFDEKWNNKLLEPLRTLQAFVNELIEEDYCEKTTERGFEGRRELMGTKSFLMLTKSDNDFSLDAWRAADEMTAQNDDRRSVVCDSIHREQWQKCSYRI
jgi:hypothetical protein